MLVVTTNEIPGWEIQRVCGEVFGVTVRSRNAFSQIGAGFKSMFGGELQGMTKNLTDSRNEVMARMLEQRPGARAATPWSACASTPSELGDDLDRAVRLRHRGRRHPGRRGRASRPRTALGYGQPGAEQQPPAAAAGPPQGSRTPSSTAAAGLPAAAVPAAVSRQQHGPAAAGLRPAAEPAAVPRSATRSQPGLRSSTRSRATRSSSSLALVGSSPRDPRSSRS